MSKFSGTSSRPVRPNVTGPLTTTDEQVPTFEGGTGYAKTAETELFQLAVTNMVGEKTFYESADVRDKRFENLVHKVAQTNPAFIAGVYDDKGEVVGDKVGFALFLRNTMNMRSASLVMAAEYAKAGGPGARKVVSNVLQRADEPAEMLGYWMGRHGKKLPKPIKRGIADAAQRLYNEYSVLKYDGNSRGIRVADVLELCHVPATSDEQNTLFRYALDNRHNRPDVDKLYFGEGSKLPRLAADRKLLTTPEGERRALLDSGLIKDAGWTWERLSGWVPGGLDAQAWESIIPTMGYMALIRNLRNIEAAKVSKTTIKAINERIADAEAVAKSRQFPYRFWSSYKANASLTFASALEEALEYATQNIPELSGRTLVLIDTSSSMTATVSNKSQVKNFEIGALFAGALSKKCEKVDTVIYGDSSAKFDLLPNESVLRFINRVEQNIGRVGHGTATWASIAQHYNGHDRVVVFTDGQTADSDSYYGYGLGRGGDRPSRQSLGIPMLHTFDLGGYATSMDKAGTSGHYAYGGFSDATFTLMKLIEEGRGADWPF